MTRFSCCVVCDRNQTCGSCVDDGRCDQCTWDGDSIIAYCPDCDALVDRIIEHMSAPPSSGESKP